jgi:hypothetical protein
MQQTILSKDGNFRADFSVSAVNFGFYRSIGASVLTYKKVTHSFLFVNYDSWDADFATSVALSVTFFSAPDPFNQTRATRNAVAHNHLNTNGAGIVLWSFGISISMDAAIGGDPDPGTASVAPNAPALPVQSVSAIATVMFPTKEAFTLKSSTSF